MPDGEYHIGEELRSKFSGRVWYCREYDYEKNEFTLWRVDDEDKVIHRSPGELDREFERMHLDTA